MAKLKRPTVGQVSTALELVGAGAVSVAVWLAWGDAAGIGVAGGLAIVFGIALEGPKKK